MYIFLLFQFHRWKLKVTLEKEPDYAFMHMAFIFGL
jgi:hypothetical protein